MLVLLVLPVLYYTSESADASIYTNTSASTHRGPGRSGRSSSSSSRSSSSSTRHGTDSCSISTRIGFLAGTYWAVALVSMISLLEVRKFVSIIHRALLLETLSSSDVLHLIMLWRLLGLTMLYVYGCPPTAPLLFHTFSLPDLNNSLSSYHMTCTHHTFSCTLRLPPSFLLLFLGFAIMFRGTVGFYIVSHTHTHTHMSTHNLSQSHYLQW